MTEQCRETAKTLNHIHEMSNMGTGDRPGMLDWDGRIIGNR